MIYVWKPKRDFGPQTFRLRNSEFRIQNSGFRLQTSSELRLQTWDLRLLWTSDFGLQTLGTSLPIFHSLLLCTNMDDVSRLPYRGALRGKKDYVGASFGSQFKWFGTSKWTSASDTSAKANVTPLPVVQKEEINFQWKMFLWCRVHGCVGRNRGRSEAC